jgi:tRNA pseudouridine13 synthase
MPEPELPRWHRDLPLLAGGIKTSPDDFVVEELPAYEPSGHGEHLFLWVEKRDLAGEELLRIFARTLHLAPGDIGAAGIKDRRAVTRQWLSVPVRIEDRIAALQSDRVRILKTARHGNKLRTGHLRGNRFSILLREVRLAKPCDLSIEQAAELLAERLRTRGFPNYYGGQRFGREGETAQLGFDLLAGRAAPRDIPFSRRKFLLRMSLSAAQSALFNRVLAERLADGLLDTVLAGDVMQVVASGGLFVVDTPATEQRRCDAGETAITGPIFGPKMKQPSGLSAQREAGVLARAGLTLDAFRAFGDLTSGTRRPFVVRPQELTVRAEPAGLRWEFALPPGVYATTLFREVLGETGDV